MPVIALNVSILSFLEQIDKGKDVILKCTDNLKVPNIGAELTEFVAAQAAYEAAHGACESAKTDCKAKTAARKAAQKTWTAKLKAAAAKIESITEGEPEAVLSTGLELKADPTPVQELEAPTGLRATTNGTPGRTKLTADPMPGALLLVVEACADPITADGWEEVARSSKPTCTAEGAEPGKKTWFRMAGMNALGQGPWCEPVARPVM